MLTILKLNAQNKLGKVYSRKLHIEIFLGYSDYRMKLLTKEVLLAKSSIYKSINVNKVEYKTNTVCIN